MIIYIKIYDIVAFLLIFLRLSGVFFIFPIFASAYTPVKFRILISLIISIFIFQNIDIDNLKSIKLNVFTVFFLSLKEVTIGFLISFISKIAIEILSFSVDIVSLQMGFNTKSLFQMDTGDHTNSFSIFHRNMILWAILALNLHHFIFKIIYYSFKMIPLNTFNLNFINLKDGVYFFEEILKIAIKFSMPILISLSLSMFILGLIARSVPQINIFTISFPVNFYIGLSIYILTAMYIFDFVSMAFQKNFYNVNNFLIGIKGG